MTNGLDGRRIAFMVANEGMEQVELIEPWQAVKDAGGRPELLAPESGQAQAFHHLDKADTFPVDRAIRDADPGDYDALVLASCRCRSIPRSRCSRSTPRLNASETATCSANWCWTPMPDRPGASVRPALRHAQPRPIVSWAKALACGTMLSSVDEPAARSGLASGLVPAL